MFDMTCQEKRVLVFLLSIGLLGVGIDFLAKRNARIASYICVGDNLAKVDLNRADRDLLLGVQGIGATLADRILEYRTSHGRFTSTDDLRRIKGITEKRLERLKEFVCVE